MSVNLKEISTHAKPKEAYYFTIFLVLIFFALTIVMRNSLIDFRIPFTILFCFIGVLVMLSSRFEVFILMLLIVTSTIFEILEFPTVPIQIGDLYLTDLLIMILLLAQMLKRVTINMTLVQKPLGYPIMLFIALGFFSFIYATMGLGVPAARAGIELRPIIYLLLFFLVYHYVKTERELKTLVLGIAIIGVVIAGFLILQYIIGDSFSILSSKVKALRTADQKFSGIMRLKAPGISIIFFSLNTFMSLFILKALKNRSRNLILPAIVLLCLSLILTFTRVFWIMVLVASLLLLFLARHKKIIYPRVMFLFISVSIGLILAFQLNAIGSAGIRAAIFNRTESILGARDLFKYDTLYWRYLDSKFAWDKIVDNPLLGVGLGNTYRPRTFGRSVYEWNLRGTKIQNAAGTMVHNGFLAVQLKMGIFGTLAFLWLIIAFFKRVFNKWKLIKDRFYQAIVLGIAVSIGGMMVHSLVAAPFFTIFWAATAAVSIGIVEKIFEFEGIA
ncbi:hypothetical protein CEE37_02270 [candidate division LCP-89 bacterium B3_LCP]|uniref:O-antigen ligase-related domain-containing protein n=1 Tax=candidate division LCP-89 bacterium B3_LCP TaxID=2012998 RepID=A0A532V5Q2_UNCL8|nr:MAG: hypothetical protein CEE37_02270 [candidate division LCP-89 bacterium B3_LCP]